MASEALKFEISAEEMATFYRVMASVDKEVARQINKRLREIAKPIENDVRRAALNLPTEAEDPEISKWRRSAKQGAQLPLRKGLAAAVETKITHNLKNGTSVRIRVSGTKFAQMTGKYRKLPRYVEGMSRKPWRHPVFADKGATGGKWDGAWVTQRKTPFLLETVLRKRPLVLRTMEQAFIEAVEVARRRGHRL